MPYGEYKEATVALPGEGGIFGEPSLRPSGGHRDCAEALTDCQVARVNKAALEGHVSRDPACALALMVAFCRWAQQREKGVAMPLPREDRSRLAAPLLSLADRFGEEAEPGVAIGLRLTHQRLAEMVACTREAVSKEMACFEREGHIETIAVVSAVDPPVSRLASSLNRDVTVSGAAALNSRYGDGSISLHAGLGTANGRSSCSTAGGSQNWPGDGEFG
jgi:hypothetical protein